MLCYFAFFGHIFTTHISPPFFNITSIEQQLERKYHSYAHSRVIIQSEEITWYREQIGRSRFWIRHLNSGSHLKYAHKLRFFNGIYDSVLVIYCATQLAYVGWFTNWPYQADGNVQQKFELDGKPVSSRRLVFAAEHWMDSRCMK